MRELNIRNYERKKHFLRVAIAAAKRHLKNSIEVKEVDLELNSFDAIVCKLGSIYLKEIDRDAIAKALESYKTGDKVKVIITT